MFTPLTNLSPVDLLDILFLSLVLYHLYVWFRGSKALRVLIGLFALAACYSLARYFGLFLTTWVFHLLWQVLVILILILFQQEIRQALERFDPLRAFTRRRAVPADSVVGHLAETARAAAQRGWGALVVIRRRDAMSDLPGQGLPVDARLSSQLLISIFNPTSPTHDGAVIFNGDRVTRLGVILPLSPQQDLPAAYGTRHRAALGITEVTDAAALVVSEETGHISLAVGGKITDLDHGQNLEAALTEVLASDEDRETDRLNRIKRLVTRNWKIKLGSLALVSLIWLMVAGQQNYQVKLEAPITYLNQPTGLQVTGLSDRDVRLSLSGPRRRMAKLKAADVKVVVDLRGLRPGNRQIGLIRQNIQIPVDVELTGIEPRVITVNLHAKEEK